MHYYNFHIGDYKSHTNHLTIIEDLAYRRLLDLYYMTEKPIIGDQAARLICMKEYGHEVLCVLLEFFEETAEGFINKRADEEIAEYYARVEQASKAGKASAEARKNRRNADVQQPFNSSSTTVQPTNNHKPITNNHKNKRVANAPLSFSEWFASLNGEKPLRDDDPIFDYCEKAKISTDILIICWQVFRKEYASSDKKYKDWREVFRKAVRGNWHKVYYLTDDGSEAKLTTVGISAMRVHQEAA